MWDVCKPCEVDLPPTPHPVRVLQVFRIGRNMFTTSSPPTMEQPALNIGNMSIFISRVKSKRLALPEVCGSLGVFQISPWQQPPCFAVVADHLSIIK